MMGSEHAPAERLARRSAPRNARPSLRSDRNPFTSAATGGILPFVSGGLLGRVKPGKLPAPILDGLAGQELLFSAEQVRAVRTFSGKVPGLVSSGSKSLFFGSFVVTDQQVIGTLGSQKVIDVSFASGDDGPVTVRLEPDGLHVGWDLDRLHPACRGSMRLHYKKPIPDEVLARVPHRELSFSVDPANVVRFAGSRKKLPDA